MLQRIAHDPLSGDPLTIDGRAMYAIRGRARGKAPALHLVYGVDVQNRLVQPAFFSLVAGEVLSEAASCPPAS